MRFIVPGPPVGKARPRLGRRGKVYTPAATRAAEARVVAAWQATDTLPSLGPLAIHLEVVVARPASHYRKHGGLTAAGLRAPHRPTKKPDLDNVLKLVSDALNGHAYKDDAQLVRVGADRCWASRGQPEHIVVHLSQTQENA